MVSRWFLLGLLTSVPLLCCAGCQNAEPPNNAPVAIVASPAPVVAPAAAPVPIKKPPHSSWAKHKKKATKPTAVVETVPDEGSPSVSFQLATIDGYAPSDENDDHVQDFREVLTKLERKVKRPKQHINPRRAISDVIVAVQKQMDNRGVHESLLDLAHHLNESIPNDFDHVMDIAEVAAAYCILRAPG